MPVSWTPEQVLSLSPDEASRKNASGLASPRKWASLGKDDSTAPGVLWGEIRGSGTDPYRCQVDLSGPSFKCSCPSRKLPCKHTLGLFLLFAGQPGAFEVSTPPDWVTAWLSKRAGQAERRAAKAEGRGPAVDTEARNRRAAERDRKIRAGIDDLETWLRDMLRQGFASAQAQPRSFWEAPAARLVDAQAPGLARLVRGMPEVVASGDGWQERLLHQVARLYLAIEGYRRIDTLLEAHQADLRTVIGFTIKQEELSEEPGVSDTWLVLGREIEEETGLKVQRVWLVGCSTGRAALLLSFAAPGSTLDTSLVPGTAIPGEVAFYPGAFPLRGLLRTHQPAQPLPNPMPGCGTLSEASAGYAAALAVFPWLERYPMLLSGVHPLNENGEWQLYDREQRRLPLSRSFAHGWTLLALSGGQPVGVFGEWNGERFLPLSAWSNDSFIAFPARLE